ncbi:MAG TPA: hypothetical protein VJK51_01560 [Candidatus Nanoarchaeia archaeon]|nr:hypothetical protein [Candidatus Nanoarchaeia archaeon]
MTLETKQEKPSWVTLKPAEVESIVIELAKKGEPPARIGLILRDQHGIPKAKLVGKKITQILKEHKLTFKTDKNTIEAKIENLKKHNAKNKKDHTAARSLTKQLWAVKKLS